MKSNSVEPVGKGLHTKDYVASISKGTVGIIHGFKCYTLQEEKLNKVNVHQNNK